MSIAETIRKSAQNLAGEGTEVIVAGVGTLDNPETNLPESLKKVLVLTVTPEWELKGAYRLSEPDWEAPGLSEGKSLPVSAFTPVDDPQPPFTVEVEIVIPNFVAVTIDGVFVRGSNSLPVEVRKIGVSGCDSSPPDTTTFTPTKAKCSKLHFGFWGWVRGMGCKSTKRKEGVQHPLFSSTH